MSDRTILQDRLGYHFKDDSFLDLALTHRSATGSDSKVNATHSNERLEFLGDRVLGLAVAGLLFDSFPNEPEGALSRRLAVLVSATTLRSVAEQLDLTSHIKTDGDVGSADTIATDTCEALIGAVFRDGGFEAACNVVHTLWRPLMAAALSPPKDAKTALQEWAQGRALPLPQYDLVDRTGPDHAPLFTIAVTVQGYGPATGEGTSKRAAELMAAQILLERLS